MPLSLGQPHFRMLLLVVVTGLPLWKNVASVPTSSPEDDCFIVSFKDLFQKAFKVSQFLQNIAASLFTDFEKQYGEEIKRSQRNLKHCHTSILDTPETKKETEEIQPEVLMKTIQTVLGAWNIPLQHLLTEMSARKEVSTPIFNKTQEVEKKQKMLLEGVQWILKKFQTGDADKKENKEEKEDKYPPFYWLPSLKSSDKNIHLFTIHNTFYCLRRDLNKIATYISVLKWRMVESITEKPKSEI